MMDEGGFAPERGAIPDGRRRLLHCLIDVVALPGSRAGLQDRAIAGDLLLELLLEADEKDMIFCARKLAETAEAPRRLLRYLGSRPAPVSDYMLGVCKGLTDSELAFIARNGEASHRTAIARRRDIGPCVGDTIIDSGDVDAVRLLLANGTAHLSEHGLDGVVNMSREAPDLCPLLLKRPEMRPAQALVMFWWSAPAERRDILLRFSAERGVLMEMCADLFASASAASRADPLFRKAMQVVERRQRNRHALERSRFGSLEEAVQATKIEGLDRELTEDISYLSGIKPVTCAQILADPGGEGVAVLCKAVGLKRPYFVALWAAMRRPVGVEGAFDPNFLRVLDIFDMMALAKAQTVLRYWNWSLSAAYSPDFLDVPGSDAPLLGDDDFTPSRRASKLIFGR